MSVDEVSRRKLESLSKRLARVEYILGRFQLPPPPDSRQLVPANPRDEQG